MTRQFSVIVMLMALSAGCAERPAASDYPRTATYALEDTAGTSLGKAYAKAAARHQGESGFHLLPIGSEALMMRIALVEKAERSIDMQYYSTMDDKTGKLMLEAVSRAADRGVRVRMLLDDWNLDDFEQGAVALNAHRNIDIRVFNPYATRDESVFARIGHVFSYAGQFTRRMHNKAIIVDNQVAIAGGRNLGDEYFDAAKEMNFRDMDVFAAGPIARELSKNFDRYWNSDESFPVVTLNLPEPDVQAVAQIREDMARHWTVLMHSPTGKRLKAMPLPQEVKHGEVLLDWGRAELIADPPEKIEQDSDTVASEPEEWIKQAAARAQHEFILFTPYFVPMDDGVEWLKAMVDRGVAVRVVTNSLASTDVVPAQAGYGHYREALVKDGVEVYEIKSSLPKPPVKAMFKPSSQNGLHAKIYMVDRREVAIGSFNFDPRSIRMNTEQLLVIHSPALCKKVARLFAHVTQPDGSYHVMLVDALPEAERASWHSGPLVWVDRERGREVYYDFNPHAGFWRRVTNGIFSVLPIDREL